MLLPPERGSVIRRDEERNGHSSKATLPIETSRRRGSNSRLPSLATLVSLHDLTCGYVIRE